VLCEFNFEQAKVKKVLRSKIKTLGGFFLTTSVKTAFAGPEPKFWAIKNPDRSQTLRVNILVV
jgi:hypothetical protein